MACAQNALLQTCVPAHKDRKIRLSSMRLKISPTHHIKGRIALPASKSYSIRAFIIAACGGKSTIKSPSDCQDAVVALKTAAALGSEVVRVGNNWSVKAGARTVRKHTFHVGESGTVLRFLLPLVSHFAPKAVIDGAGTLVGRPNHHLNAALRKAGLDIQGTGAKESVPIAYKGGSINGESVSVDGSLSSQFISAAMIACALRNETTRLRITGRTMVSRDYITMTRQILLKAGIKVNRKSEREYLIPGGQQYKGLKNFTVPSDYGLAAFFLAAGALLPSDLTLTGALKDDLMQSDGHILPFLRKMGVRFQKTDRFIRIKGPFKLKGGTFSLKDCPDLVPIMAVLGMFATAPIRLVDIHHARAKESDRISELREELVKVGANIRESRGSLTVIPAKSYETGHVLGARHDHRLAMAFSILGLRIGLTVEGMESTRKSYPGFVKDLKGLAGVKAGV